MAEWRTGGLGPGGAVLRRSGGARAAPLGGVFRGARGRCRLLGVWGWL